MIKEILEVVGVVTLDLQSLGFNRSEKQKLNKKTYKYTNNDYNGGWTITITTDPYNIRAFLWLLNKINPELLKKIKKTTLVYKFSEISGHIPYPSMLEIEYDFAQKIKLQGYYSWRKKRSSDRNGKLFFDFDALNTYKKEVYDEKKKETKD